MKLQAESCSLVLTPYEASVLKEDSECPSCLKQMTVPGFLCKKGHNACYKCKNSRSSCKVCGEIYKFHIVLDGIMNKPCIFSECGCLSKFPYSLIKQHQESCEFRPLGCPLSGTRRNCWWRGQLQDLKVHLEENHFIKRSFRYIEVKNVLSRENITALLKHKNSIYVFNMHIDITEDVFYSYLQLVGDSVEALTKTCRLKITKNNTMKIMFKTKVWSYATSKKDIPTSGQCARIPFKVLRHYLAREKDLSLSLKIYEIDKGEETSLQLPNID